MPTTEEELAVKELLVVIVNNLDKIMKFPGKNEKGSNLEKFFHVISCNEVFPGVYIGNVAAAKDKQFLKELGITHVVNVAQGARYAMVDTSPEYYADTDIKYLGFELTDDPNTDISAHFSNIADVIEDALKGGGKVLCHCLMGMSRSATVVLAYLMLKQSMSVREALTTVCKHRFVRPNEGFLLQLVHLDEKLTQERGIKEAPSPTV